MQKRKSRVSADFIASRLIEGEKSVLSCYFWKEVNVMDDDFDASIDSSGFDDSNSAVAADIVDIMDEAVLEELNIAPHGNEIEADSGQAAHSIPLDEVNYITLFNETSVMQNSNLSDVEEERPPKFGGAIQVEFTEIAPLEEINGWINDINLNYDKLGVSSAVNYERHLQAFIDGHRN